jgi:hypothetical protein
MAVLVLLLAGGALVFNARSAVRRQPPPQQEQQEQPAFPRGRRSNAPRMYADTDEGGRACHSLFRWPLEESRSSGAAWNMLQDELLFATGSHPHEHATSTRFPQWVRELRAFYTPDRLRRSRAHPAPASSLRRILELVTLRLQDPLANDPVRIMVVGGSVTAGIASCANHVGLPDLPSPDDVRCAWPHRLGRMLDEVLFRGGGGGGVAGPSGNRTDVFDVWNAAVPGFDSGMGAILFEYQLLEGLNGRRPHVVISAHSPNDAKDADPANLWLTGQQDLVRSAHKLRPCDDDLPLIVLADDLFGDLQLKALEQTGFVYKTSSWYNLMSIAYSNVARHASVANWHGSHHVDPMFGSNFGIHLGTGFHIAMAWTVLFNIIDALYETCVDDAETVMPPPPPPESPNATTATASLSSTSTFLEPNTKYRSRYGPSHQVKREWEANVLAKERLCNGSITYPKAEPPRFATNVCTYGWLAHIRSSIAHPWNVVEAMEPVLVEAAGWRAKPVVKRTP